MSDGNLAVLALTLSGFSLLCLVVLTIVILRRLPRRNIKEETADPFAGPRNPIITLGFTESLDVDKFAVAIQQSALSELSQIFSSRAADGVVVTINSVRFFGTRAELVFSASQHGQKLIEQGLAEIARQGPSGPYLPNLKNKETGRFIEIFKGQHKSPLQLATLSAAIIGAAHIISGADIARRLKEVEAKIDLLIVYRRIDQMAALERIYTAAKELLAGPLGSEERWELWRLRNELRELRLAWRREFQYHLNLIEDPQDAGWLKRMFTLQRSTDKRIQSKITDAQIKVALVEYSIRLDHVLAAVGGTLDKFEATLGDELADLEEVAKLLQSKAGLISEKLNDLSVEPTVNAMTAIVQHYRELLPDIPPSDTTSTEVPTTTKQTSSSAIKEQT